MKSRLHLQAGHGTSFYDEIGLVPEVVQLDKEPQGDRAVIIRILHAKA